MKFYTTVKIEPFKRQLTYEHKMLFMGSCFADSLCMRFGKLKMRVSSNPFGVLYNPHSLAQSIFRMADQALLTEGDLRYENGLWFSYTHHGYFARHDKELALVKHNESINRGHAALSTADYLIITLGTAWVYRHNESKTIVANCHKTPNADFTRLLLTPDEVGKLLCDMIFRAQQLNPKLRVILTISPVRHSGDGAHGSNLGKASLLLGVEQALRRCNSTFYFPAYEIMVDELRDYRFYAPDMLHPSDVATEHICERFEQVAVDPDALHQMFAIRRIIAAMQHRPLHTDSGEYRAFCTLQRNQIAELKEKLPHTSWKEEDAYFALR